VVEIGKLTKTVEEAFLRLRFYSRERAKYLRYMNSAKKRLAKDRMLIEKWKLETLEADEHERRLRGLLRGFAILLEKSSKKKSEDK